MEQETITQYLDFFLIVLKHHEIAREDSSDEESEIIHVGCYEDVQAPNTVCLSNPDCDVPRNYTLCVLIGWKEHIRPETGASEGHYTADVKVNEEWFHANDSKVKKISKHSITKKPVIMLYSKYYM